MYVKMNVDGSQLVMSAAALAAAYFLVQQGKSKAGYGKINPNDPVDGLNNLKDVPLYPQNGIDTYDTRRPSCQTWDVASGIYINAGDPKKDANMTLCYQELDDSLHPRYIGADGKLHFKNEDNLKEDPKEAGLCYFWNGTAMSNFADVGTLNPVNRSSRLCFASSTPGNVAHHFIRHSDGQVIFSPQIAVGNNLVWDQGSQLVGRKWGTEPQSGGFCEEWTEVRNPAGRSLGFAWNVTDQSQNQKDVRGCATFKGTPALQTRWVDRDGGQFVFANPNNPSDLVSERIDEHALWN